MNEKPVHPKIEEYADRIESGESLESITQGLPQGMSDALKMEIARRERMSQDRKRELEKELGIENKVDVNNPSLAFAKKKIMKEIDFAKSRGSEVDFKLISKLLMEGLTHRSEYIRSIEKDEFALMNGFAEEKKGYRAKMEKLAQDVVDSGMKYDGNPAWFGINTVPEKPKTKEINRKFYATLPTSNIEFVDHVKDLAESLRKLSLDTDDIIQVKIPGGYGGFFAHRDSVVIHFKDPDNTEKVREVFNEWKKRFGISEEERELGRTQVAADSRETSFSDLVATAMIGYLKDNLGKYDTDALLDKTLEHAVLLSQKGPTITKK